MVSVVSVPLTLLGLLEREPSHGYDLKRDYDAYFGRGRPLPFGQVYATLGRLARDGKVVAGDAEPGAGPDRKRYAITDLGVNEVEAWLRQPVEPEPHLQTVLFAKVVLALMLGRPAEGYLDTQRAAHVQRMRELTDLKRTGSLVDGLLADHGPLPSRSRPSLDRCDPSQAQRAGGNGAYLMTSLNMPPAADARRCVIEARDVHRSFGQTAALAGASLSATRGEILAVMGPSGLTRSATPSAPNCGARRSGSCFSSASLCPS